jgi:hypothetical protein
MKPHNLPPCHSRRDWHDDEQFFCAHPKVFISNQLVTPHICRICSKWQEPPPPGFRPEPTQLASRKKQTCLHLGELREVRECAGCRGNVRIKVFDCHHDAHDTTTAKDCWACIDHEAKLKKGKIRNWAVGVTTAPRKEPTLARTLGSLAAAGWPNPRLFAEQGSDIPTSFGGSVTWRTPPIGAWSNWFTALGELYQREPQADAFLLIQDDVVFVQGLRDYLEVELWPDERTGVVSVYTSAMYVPQRPGFAQLRHSVGLIGALALIFPPSAVRSLLSDAFALRHSLNERNGQRDIDQVIAHWSLRTKRPLYVHSPSLGQHIGQTSTVWEGAHASGHRRAGDFPGEDRSVHEFINQ